MGIDEEKAWLYRQGTGELIDQLDDPTFEKALRLAQLVKQLMTEITN